MAGRVPPVPVAPVVGAAPPLPVPLAGQIRWLRLSTKFKNADMIAFAMVLLTGKENALEIDLHVCNPKGGSKCCPRLQTFRNGHIEEDLLTPDICKRIHGYAPSALCEEMIKYFHFGGGDKSRGLETQLDELAAWLGNRNPQTKFLFGANISQADVILWGRLCKILPSTALPPATRARVKRWLFYVGEVAGCAYCLYVKEREDCIDAQDIVDVKAVNTLRLQYLNNLAQWSGL